MPHRNPFSASRRRVLCAGIAAGSLALARLPARAAIRAQPRTLSFYHLHTDERLAITYFDGDYVPQALGQIDWLLRDFRTGDVRAIDRDLLDTLHTLADRCGGGTFEVISGYRSSTTNEALQKRTDGVAKHSLHLVGKAIDVRLSGFDTAKLREAALGLGRGGVGYYPASDFVHLDTGRVRAW
jgi:uncharacterized protein YcbK (DUF882 family)